MYQHIMVPLDGSKLAECVLPHVEVIARGCNAKKVTFARVVEPLHFYGGVESRFSPEERQRLEAVGMDSARSYLDQIVRQLKYNRVKIQFEVLYGKVADELADYVNQNEVDLIIISTHGHSGLGRWVWGNVADRILRHTSVPVFMVRALEHVPGV